MGWSRYQDMIVCPYCLHQNFDSASHCEACHTPLPENTRCSNCGASVPAEASFCGQCGAQLRQSVSAPQAQGASLSELVPEPRSPESIASALAPAEQLEPEPQPDPPIAYSGTRAIGPQTQLQRQRTASLLHIQSGQTIALPQRNVIHIGKLNDRVPPDIDVSGFSHSEIVSRIHAVIRVEEEFYFVEDTGSANGTYVNYTVLPSGNRHRLKHSDRLALGKGDLVSFLFQLE